MGLISYLQYMTITLEYIYIIYYLKLHKLKTTQLATSDNRLLPLLLTKNTKYNIPTYLEYSHCRRPKYLNNNIYLCTISHSGHAPLTFNIM